MLVPAGSFSREKIAPILPPIGWKFVRKISKKVCKVWSQIWPKSPTARPPLWAPPGEPPASMGQPPRDTLRAGRPTNTLRGATRPEEISPPERVGLSTAPLSRLVPVSVSGSGSASARHQRRLGQNVADQLGRLLALRSLRRQPPVVRHWLTATSRELACGAAQVLPPVCAPKLRPLFLGRKNYLSPCHSAARSQLVSISISPPQRAPPSTFGPIGAYKFTNQIPAPNKLNELSAMPHSPCCSA